MKVSHAWLKDYLGDTAPTPQEMADLLTFHAFEIEEVDEQENDTVIDVDILPNRSSDCLCHRGIAREIASITGKPLAHDPLQQTPDVPVTDLISVEIESTEICPRFTASLITDIEVKESPQWLQERLAAIGQRSINNIVDATNYVMFAIGQPLHAYDADLFPQVDGQWKFGVRYATEGETVSLLAEGGGDEDRIVELKGTEVLVVDNSSNTPIGLAGVKGGRFAGVHSGTTKVIIEAAHWNPIVTRTTARGLGIVIDASKRFENEPSRALPPYAQAEIIQLITDIAGGQSEGMIDIYLEALVRTECLVTVEKTNALLGLDLSADTMQQLLEQAGIAVSSVEGGFMATGPIERTDLMIEEDFIEEIGRLYGYDKVAAVVPEPVALTELNARHYYSEKIRDSLIRQGFSEVITSSFRKKDTIKLFNALASDKGCMRSSLIKNITEALERNVGFTDLLGKRDTRMFEIGTVFTKGGEFGVTEHMSLCLGVRTKAKGFSKGDEEVLQAVIGELTNDIDADLSFDIVDGVAELNISALINTTPVPTAYDDVEMSADIQYQPYSAYPHVSRDIALWVQEGTTADVVAAVLTDNAGALHVRTSLFDEFSKDGRTSYAFRLVFQSEEKTLTDEEVNTIMDTVYKVVEEKGWETR